MIVTYEKGDVVEIQDSVGAPNDMGACTVTLLNKVGPDKWNVRVDEKFDPDTPDVGVIGEEWFV